MQLALDGNYDLKLIQQCCLWLQVGTVANISNSNRNRIEKWAFSKKGRRGKLHWINQGEPSSAAWKAWKKYLKLLLSTYGRSAGKLSFPHILIGHMV